MLFILMWSCMHTPDEPVEPVPSIPSACLETEWRAGVSPPSACREAMLAQVPVDAREEVEEEIVRTLWSLARAPLPEMAASEWQDPGLIHYLNAIDENVNEALYGLVVRNVEVVVESATGRIEVPKGSRTVRWEVQGGFLGAYPWHLTHEAVHTTGDFPDHVECDYCRGECCDADGYGGYGMTVLVADLFIGVGDLMGTFAESIRELGIKHYRSDD